MNEIFDYPTPYGAGEKPLRLFQGRLILVLICFYLVFILPVYIDNNAGSGLAMPQNILAWGVMILCSAVVLVSLIRSGFLLWGPFMMLMVVAGILMMLPWLWTSSELWQRHALPHMAGMAGALMFVIALCQIRITHPARRVLMAVVVISSLEQAGEAMIQAWMPGVGLKLMDFCGTSPYGIFQQRNLLASWLATGTGVALYLAITARKRTKAVLWILALYPLCAGIVLSQSRMGVLGLTLSVLLVITADLPHLRHRPQAVLRRVMIFISLMVWCTGIGLWAMPSGEPIDLVHEKSTVERVVMLEGAAEMIKQHPVSGNGLGSFEAQFPKALSAAGLVQNADTVTHPHNELMYVWAEGGISALVGLLILGGIWIWPVIYRLRNYETRGMCYETRPRISEKDRLIGAAWLLPLSGLPLVIHMMLEYPFYLSAPHLLLLLLLFRIGLPETVLTPIKVSGIVRSAAFPMLLCASGALVLLYYGFNTQVLLTRAEEQMNQGLIPSLPDDNWQTVTQAERLDYDRHLLIANTPGFLRQPKAMAIFTVWGERWLTVHNSAEVSAAMILIAKRRGDYMSAEKLKADAARVFAADERFRKGAL